MRKLKRSEPERQDRLSELPDSVIFHILWFVPMSDVIKTAVLSRRWRSLCTTTHYLNFVNVYGDDNVVGLRKIVYYTNRFRDLVNRALLCWSGERILKFKVASSHKLEMSIYGDIDVWLRLAKKHDVEELYLHLHRDGITSGSGPDFDELYRVPQFLCSCSSLKQLSFRQCNFDISKNVQWKQLKSLTITESLEVTEDLVNQILSGSPRLEAFVLSHADIGESLSIQSKSLKELSIYRFVYERDYLCRYEAENGGLWMGIKLKIRTPNLETLEMKGIPYGEYLLYDISSLTHVTLGFSGMHFLYEDHEHSLTTSDFLGGVYSQILPCITHVEHVTLCYCCIKVLGAMNKRCMHSSFPNVKSLRIGYRFNEYEQLVVILESFPQLETLVLQAREEDKYHDERDFLKFDSGSYLKFFEATLPNSFLLQLRRVEVTWAEGDNVFPFIEIVLIYARKLEKMIFRVKETGPPSSPSYSSSPSPSPPSNPLVLASRKLLKMRRTSAECTIDIL